MRLFVRAHVALLFVVLAACGGGGGGGGSGGATNGSGSGTSTARGQFTLSESTASFAMLQGVNEFRRLQLTVTGTDVAYVGAAYTEGQSQQAWLGVDIGGAGSTYEVVLAVSSILPPGNYSSTFSVGTADADGNVLQSRPITVTLTIESRLGLASTKTDFAFIYGGEVATQDVAFDVTALDKQWHATSNVPWLQVPAEVQDGDGALTASIDVESLLPGTYAAEVTVVSDGTIADSATRAISVTVEPPGLSAQYPVFEFGGEDGLSFDTQTLTMALNTGGRAHPFTIETNTDSGDDWLRPSVASGMVGESGAIIDFTAEPAFLLGGTYTGEIVLNITVDELVITHRIPATMNIEANRLVVGAAGVMFSSSPPPARSVLTRDVKVHSSIDRTDVPWSASVSPDQSWLSVTATGVTGEDIRLTADPVGLDPDTTHFATVSIGSSDPTVENEQSIRVGLYINSAAPQDFSLAQYVAYSAASQVEPIVFTSDGGADVIGYNVYTGEEERTYSDVVTQAGNMILSEDGLRLFVYDIANFRVTELNAATGDLVRHYESGDYEDSGGSLTYFRPDGYEVLMTPSAYMYELPSSGDGYVAEGFAPRSAESFAPSYDQRYLVDTSGFAYRLKRSALNGGEMRGSFAFQDSANGGNPRQACLSADGTTIYSANANPAYFPGTNIQTGEDTQLIAGDSYPNAIRCLWNGVIVGGIADDEPVNDVWIYDGPTGQELANVSSMEERPGNAGRPRDRGIAVSGDATRMITISVGQPYDDPEMRIQSIPGPL